jgi:hypothetical protein
MYYDKSALLSYNKILNFVIGNRGSGKTYGFKKWAIKDFLKNGNQFIYLRRYKQEFKKIRQFFADIKHEFPNDSIEVKGMEAYINDKLFGYFIPLSTSSKEKSTSYEKVNKIIYDEFLIDKGAYRPLTNEVDIYLEFFETVARMRDNVRGIFIGNAISIVNPYFLHWNIRPDLDKRFTVSDNIVIELHRDEVFIQEKQKTKFGQLIMGTTYGDYAINNQFLRDNDTFIAPKTNKADFMLAMKYKSVMYGYWVDYDEGLIYVNRQYDPSSYNLYSVTKDDHDLNLLLIKSLKDCKPVMRIVYAFQNGLLRFEDMQVKKQFYEYIHFFLR